MFKRDTIPEFVLVKNIQHVYQIFCDANKKNKILLKSQYGDEFLKNEERKKQFYLQNIKDDIVLVQYKLVSRTSGKTHNVQSFINVPTSKLHDINLQMLIEIISKQNQNNANPAMQQKKKQTVTFLPYNKSILTRVIHKQLKCNNVLVINHYSKVAIQRHLR